MRYALALTTVALGLVVASAPSALAEGDEAGASAKAVAIKIDIAETVADKPSSYMLTAYFVRKKLRELGFDAWSARAISIDKKERAKRAEAAEKNGTEPEPLLEDVKPEPIYVIEGKTEVKFDRKSTFYGEDLAFVYTAATTITIKNQAGKVLETFTIEQEWGKSSEKKAKNEALQRNALFAAADVLASATVQSALTDPGKVEAQRFIDKTNAKRKK